MVGIQFKLVIIMVKVYILVPTGSRTVACIITDTYITYGPAGSLMNTYVAV